MLRARAAALLLCAAAASAQCVPFTLPPVWPASARAPPPPYVSVSSRGGSTLDSVTLVTVGTVTAQNNQTTRLGGAGGPNVKRFSCSNASAYVIGFGYTIEATSTYLPYGMFSALHRIGPWRCSDGSTNYTLQDSLSPQGNDGAEYVLPVNLCGGPPGSPSITPTAAPTGGPAACVVVGEAYDVSGAAPVRLAQNWFHPAPLRDVTTMRDPGLAIAAVEPVPGAPGAFVVTLTAARLPAAGVWLESLLCCGRFSDNDFFMTQSPLNVTYTPGADARGWVHAPPPGAETRVTAGQFAASLTITSLLDMAGYGA